MCSCTYVVVHKTATRSHRGQTLRWYKKLCRDIICTVSPCTNTVVHKTVLIGESQETDASRDYVQYTLAGILVS